MLSNVRGICRTRVASRSMSPAELAHLSKSSNVLGEGLWMVAQIVMPVSVNLCRQDSANVSTC